MTDHIFLLLNFSIILESLPISSSGHLGLITQFLGSKEHISSSTEHLMHIPNALIILALLIRYGFQYVHSFSAFISLGLAIALANFITSIGYLTIKKRVAQLPLYSGFLISACALLSLYWAPTGSLTTINISHAMLIGCAQTLALLPGVSRMALSTVTGIWLGIAPEVSFLFSLACELVLIGGAVVIALYNTHKESLRLTQKQMLLIALSTLFSYGALELSRYGFMSNSIALLGWYLIGISLYAILRKVTAQAS